MMPAVVDEKDTTLILKGEFRLLEGEADIFGCPIKNINTEKFVPIYINGRAEVEGEYIPVKGRTIPESWIKAVKKIEDCKKVFVVGDVDVGKSSFITWLVNALPEKKCIIDADMGQSDIAHPGAMGIGIAEKTPMLSEVKMVDGFFTGCLSPMGREAKCLKGFNVLCKKAEKVEAEVTIVDTTGWIRGKRAREYKAAKIEIFSPDVVVFISESNESLNLINLLDFDCDVIRVKSFVPKKRSKDVRCRLRMNSYKKWFENPVTVEVKPENVRTTLFKGRSVEDLEILSVFGDVIFAEVGYDFLNVCVENMEVSYETVKTIKKLFDVEDVNVFEPDCLKNLIVGVYVEDRYLCPGLLADVDFENRMFYVSVGSAGSVSSDLVSSEFKADKVDKADKIFVDLGEFKITDEKEVIVRVP